MKTTNTILIVDDEVIGRETLDALLSDQGYKLAFASCGQEALIKAAQLIPDVILLDVMMPGLNGFEVCKCLRADVALAKVPVIMLTALDDRESRLEGIKAGADDFISKPYDAIELRARLRTITHLNRYRRLLTEQAKFEWVVEQANEAFLILNHNDQVLYANSQARLNLDLCIDTNNLTNETFLEIVTKQYHCEPQQAWATWLKYVDQATPRYLVRPETTTAYAFWLQVDVMEMSIGSEEKYLVRLRNVTDIILAERQRWSFQKQITHKLKTPLFPLMGGIEYLKDNLSQISKEDIKEFLETAYSGALRLQNEIENILKYLNVSSMDELEYGTCNLADILVTITAVKDIIKIENVHVSQKDIEDSNNTYISISLRAIELILSELFSNAQKFHPTRTPTLEVNIAATSEEICLQIGDDGLTLSPEQLANIWTPYYQGEKHFTGESQGMGLGLSMIASLVWDVGGTCRSYNHTGKQGIVMEITLPLAISEDEEFVISEYLE
ncbi:response regulator [Candidatus Parabeggiatoa sp. HSG14]|uniref:ATP-binding response regulator n=1 Tax=Candidatus Parabeggiatoa sp. HSG14 TaxID=3055593 RepID=UPI0025A90B0B|nr:response regulator [Thiotrichales bacterium HSG14]